MPSASKAAGTGLAWVVMGATLSLVPRRPLGFWCVISVNLVEVGQGVTQPVLLLASVVFR